MAEIIKTLEIDEHYIITSEVAQQPPAPPATGEEALKGFAFGTSAGRILSATELMQAKPIRAESIVNQRATRELLRRQPIVSRSLSTLDVMVNIAVGATEKIGTALEVGKEIAIGQFGKIKNVVGPIADAGMIAGYNAQQKIINMPSRANAALENQLLVARRTIKMLNDKLAMAYLKVQNTRNAMVESAMDFGKALKTQKQMAMAKMNYVAAGMAPLLNMASIPLGAAPISFTPRIETPHQMGTNLNRKNRRGF